MLGHARQKRRFFSARVDSGLGSGIWAEDFWLGAFGQIYEHDEHFELALVPEHARHKLVRGQPQMSTEFLVTTRGEQETSLVGGSQGASSPAFAD